MTNKLLASLFLIAISVNLGFSQITDKVALSFVLDSLEAHYNVTFSYADESIKGIELKSYPPLNNLEEDLNELESETGLSFNNLGNRIITIYQDREQIINCGIISDKTTGRPLEGATVISEKGFEVSDNNGHFELKKLLPTDSVTIQFFGYKTRQIGIRQSITGDCLEINLDPITTILNTVTVKNYLVEGINKNDNGSISIEMNETEILPGLIEPDILYTVQQLPGIQSVDETVSNINVRGGTNDQNLILWDGVKMYQTGHFFGLISAFNPYITEEVTFIKNGSPAQYKEGVSSIIDIKTYDEVNENLEIGAGLNMINGDIYFKAPLNEKIAIHGAARRSIADFINTPTFDNYFDRAFRGTEVGRFLISTDVLSADENFSFYDYSGKLLYDISARDNLRISFLKVYNQLEYQETGVFANSEQTKNSELEQYNLAGAIRYKRRWQESVNSRISLDLSSYNLNATNFDIPNDQRFFQENEVLDLNLSSSVEWRLSDLVALDIGYQFNEIGVTNKDEVSNPEFKRNTTEVLRTHVNFLESSFTSRNSNLVGSVGIRNSYFTKFDKWRFEPRLSINYIISRDLTLELLAETKSQVTTQIIDFQTDFLGVEKRRWVLVNNNDIPLITSRQISLGAHYQQKYLLLSLEGYIKEVDGIISSSQGFQNQFEFVRSVGSYFSRGFDFLVKTQIDDFNLWSSYSYSINTYNFPELNPSEFANNLDIRHTISLGSNYKIQRLEVSAGLNFHTGRPYTQPTEADPIINDRINYLHPNSSRLENYIRPDLSVRYEFSMSKLKVKTGISLWNFIDRKNTINRFYIIDERNSTQLIENNALGLTPNMMVRIIF